MQVKSASPPLGAVLAGSLALTLVACGPDQTGGGADRSGEAIPAAIEAPKTLLAIVEGDSDLARLRTAIETGEARDLLTGAGPVTLFAPTDDAFAMLGDGQMSDLEADSSAIARILGSHLVEGRLDAAALMQAIASAGADGHVITTVSGASLRARMDDGALVLIDEYGTEATVTAADIAAGNGLVHTVDRVLTTR
ncbi:fasciclin domain-containing protein [Qipengyuania nanhaisediminis]|uniref:fasciclin domain-containing protein n=1 Tax=Qipengyuania nanhaisediminis TaxID=604088 RepID=UPI0038B40E9B